MQNVLNLHKSQTPKIRPLREEAFEARQAAGAAAQNERCDDIASVGALTLDDAEDEAQEATDGNQKRAERRRTQVEHEEIADGVSNGVFRFDAVEEPRRNGTSNY